MPSGAESKIREAIDIALKYQGQGRLRAAGNIYRRVLRVEPENPDALHFLGVIAHKIGRADLAMELLARSIASDPARVGFRLNLGSLYLKRQQVDEAIACYRDAIALAPTSASAYAHLAAALARQGKLEEANLAFDRATELKALPSQAIPLHVEPAGPVPEPDTTQSAPAAMAVASPHPETPPTETGLAETLGLLSDPAPGPGPEADEASTDEYASAGHRQRSEGPLASAAEETLRCDQGDGLELPAESATSTDEHASAGHPEGMRIFSAAGAPTGGFTAPGSFPPVNAPAALATTSHSGRSEESALSLPKGALSPVSEEVVDCAEGDGVTPPAASSTSTDVYANAGYPDRSEEPALSLPRGSLSPALEDTLRCDQGDGLEPSDESATSTDGYASAGHQEGIGTFSAAGAPIGGFTAPGSFPPVRAPAALATSSRSERSEEPALSLPKGSFSPELEETLRCDQGDGLEPPDESATSTDEHASAGHPERSEGPLASAAEEAVPCVQGDGLAPSSDSQISTVEVNTVWEEAISGRVEPSLVPEGFAFVEPGFVEESDLSTERSTEVAWTEASETSIESEPEGVPPEKIPEQPIATASSTQELLLRERPFESEPSFDGAAGFAESSIEIAAEPPDQALEAAPSTVSGQAPSQRWEVPHEPQLAFEPLPADESAGAVGDVVLTEAGPESVPEAEYLPANLVETGEPFPDLPPVLAHEAPNSAEPDTAFEAGPVESVLPGTDIVPNVPIDFVVPVEPEAEQVEPPAVPPAEDAVPSGPIDFVIPVEPENRRWTTTRGSAEHAARTALALQYAWALHFDPGHPAALPTRGAYGIDDEESPLQQEPFAVPKAGSAEESAGIADGCSVVPAPLALVSGADEPVRNAVPTRILDEPAAVNTVAETSAADAPSERPPSVDIGASAPWTNSSGSVESVRDEPGNFSSAAGALTGGTLLGAAKPPVGAPAALKVPKLDADPAGIADEPVQVDTIAAASAFDAGSELPPSVDFAGSAPRTVFSGGDESVRTADRTAVFHVLAPFDTIATTSAVDAPGEWPESVEFLPLPDPDPVEPEQAADAVISGIEDAADRVAWMEDSGPTSLLPVAETAFEGADYVDLGLPDDPVDTLAEGTERPDAEDALAEPDQMAPAACQDEAEELFDLDDDAPPMESLEPIHLVGESTEDSRQEATEWPAQADRQAHDGPLEETDSAVEAAPGPVAVDEPALAGWSDDEVAAPVSPEGPAAAFPIAHAVEPDDGSNPRLVDATDSGLALEVQVRPGLLGEAHAQVLSGRFEPTVLVAKPPVDRSAETLPLPGAPTLRSFSGAAATAPAGRGRPPSAESLRRRGVALISFRRLDEAVHLLNRAVALRPKFAEAHRDLGGAMLRQGNLEGAIVSLQRALKLRPTFAEAWGSLGDAYQLEGKISQAIRCYRRLLELVPRAAKVHSNMLLSMNYDSQFSAQEVFHEHVRWAERHAERHLRDIQRHTNDRTPNRRLMIGYVSPDFRRHSVNYFAEPVLAGHHRPDFHVTCYSDVVRPDGVTRGLAGLSDAFRDTHAMNDEQLAAQIRADGIDILVDLSGHTGNNRLGTFARKPAPIQVTYLGYPNTTGLSTIDYRITDALADPPGETERFHSEHLVRLPDTFLCYQPPHGSPDVGPLPCLKAGYVTFGCFNILAKITDQVMSLWARVLQELPNSRLVLKGRSNALSSEKRRQHVRDIFVNHGISPDRLELLGKEPSYAQHLTHYGRLDIVLDPFPYTGTTTTCEALWMGLPVVTLAGDRHVSRVGVSILTNVGLPELIAATPEQYVRIATSLADSPGDLSRLRSTLRDRMRRSPLTDSIRLTRALEAEYRSMWEHWCQSDAGSPSPRDTLTLTDG